MSRSKSSFAALLAACLALVLAAPAFAAEAQKFAPATVRVAYMPNLGSASSLFTAMEQGYFKDVALDVQPFEFQGGPAEIAAMGSGDIDIAQIGHGAHKLCIQGQAKIFEMDQNGLADAVVANKAKGVSSIKDLKGKTIAVQTGTSSEIILLLALEDAGMKIDDMKVVQMEGPGMVTALVSGQVDAAATWSPFTVTMQKGLGGNYILLAGNADYTDRAAFPGSFITTEKYAAANPEVLARFAAAIERAKLYRAAHIDDVARMLAKRLESPEETMLAATGEGDWQGAADCEGDLEAIKGFYQAQQKVFINNGAVKEPVPLESYILFDVMQKGHDLAQTLK